MGEKMKILVRIRGNPESVLSVLKRVSDAEGSNCTVVFSVSSQDELLKLVSASVECGATVEIMPDVGNPTPPVVIQPSQPQRPPPKDVREERRQAEGHAEEKSSRTDEISMLAKYKRRSESQTQERPHQQVAPQEERRPVAPSQPSVGETKGEARPEAKQESGSEPKAEERESQGGAKESTPTKTEDARPEAPKEKPKEEAKREAKAEQREEENLLAKAEEMSQDRGISFDELVRLKEEAFSRKIVE